MSASISTMQGLLRNLIQTTTDATPDNPAEVLTVYTATSDGANAADAYTFPNAGHSTVYKYNDATSLWNKAQWS